VMLGSWQAESLHHSWQVCPRAYEAGIQPPMCFLTVQPRAATDEVVLALG
jgi:hypothetical protein